MAGALAFPGPGEVIVCLASRGRVLATGGDDLDPVERARAEAIGHSRSLQRFRAGRLLLRRVVARLSGTTPAAVALEGGEGEAPRLLGALSGLRASVSHGEETEAVAIAGAPVGIDVEDECPADFRALAPVVMHAGELDAFGRLAATEAPDAFRRLWTRKEAVLKAAGLGFSRDPRSFAVGLGSAQTVDLDAARYAVADLPDGIGAVALAGTRVILRPVPVP